jgi:plastocyanin
MPTRLPLRAAVIAAACVTAGAVIVPAANSSTRRSVTKKVEVIDNAFTPTKVTITSGSSVRWAWSNQNYNTHNVTLQKGPKGVKKFRSVNGARGLTFTHKFTKAGTYTFNCTIHPDMIVKVTVKKK